jgi:uncharacterized protein
MRNLIVLQALVIALAGLSVGCRTTRPSRFYVLRPVAAPAAAPDAALQGLSISLAAVDLPAYLDRPQIVTREEPSELRLGEYDRWGEPLKESVARVIGENLSALLGTEKVSAGDRDAADVRVAISLARFDPDADGTVVLDARWSVSRERGSPPLRRRSRIARPGTGGYLPLVEAESEALAALGREIAEAIRTAGR